MASFPEKSRSVELIFDRAIFFKKLADAPPSTNTLLVASLAKADLLNSLGYSIAEESVNQEARIEFEHTAPKRVNQYLGLETNLLFFDASIEFDVNAFTAICGTLVGGGRLVLLLEPQLEFLLKDRSSGNQKISSSKTLIRFIKYLSLTRAVTVDTLNSATLMYTLPELDYEYSTRALSTALENQQGLIASIKRCAKGHAKRPIVVAANRGRGKSAALGIAAAELLAETKIDIYITAPRKQQLAVFYRHLHSRLTELTDNDNAKRLIDHQIIFLPPDEASALDTITGLLIVEEAGALPTQVLSGFLKNSNRMIFSTTIDGYEGNGQGFEIRFKALLRESFPQFKTMTLCEPVRWSKHDLLEQALNNAFLLDLASHRAKTQTSQTKPLDNLKIHLVEKQELNDNEILLRSVYQLLVNAHYQTRPSDLEKILSQQSLSVIIARIGSCVVAASLVCQEGKLSKTSLTQIQQANLRLPGHLLPQSLIAHQGITKAAELSFLRVMRIAVAPQFRRKGIASRVLNYLERFASSNQVDLIGTSFSLFTDVVKFWFVNGFSATRIGVRKDSSTGAHTGEFLKLVNNSHKESSDVYQQAMDRFNQSFCYLVSSSLKVVASDVLLLIFMMQPYLKITNRLEETQYQSIKKEIKHYFAQRRSLEMVEWQLYLMTKNCLCGLYEGNIGESVSTSEEKLENYRLVFAKLIQRKSWNDIKSEFKLTGIKQSREKSRLILDELNTKLQNN